MADRIFNDNFLIKKLFPSSLIPPIRSPMLIILVQSYLYILKCCYVIINMTYRYMINFKFDYLFKIFDLGLNTKTFSETSVICMKKQNLLIKINVGISYSSSSFTHCLCLPQQLIVRLRSIQPVVYNMRS